MAAPGDEQSGSGPAGGDRASASRPRLKVLVVEDHVEMAQLMARLLVLWGHDAMIAHDGATALALAQTQRPRVILADIDLPDMNGYQLAREIRELPDLKNCLLIAQTGYAQEEDRNLGIEAGYNHYLIKPVDLKMLRQTLNDLALTRPAQG